MIEKPISVGDILEVEGVRGSVSKIGARSTTIITFDNIDIVVPNSSFLETNVVNWTLRDSTIRRKVKVGIAYGSDTRKAQEVLLQVLKSHADILKSPEPYVLFTDFGDSALLFECLFWVNLRSMKSALIVETEVRLSIDDVLKENNIVIAFPQRDVHLSADQPISVRVLDGDQKG